MKAHMTWSYAPYSPLLRDAGRPYICRVAPGMNEIHIEWLPVEGEETYRVFLGKMGEEPAFICETLRQALEIADGKCLLNGNIDPVADVYTCDAAHTRQAILDAASSVSNARALFMPGCELPTDTKAENILAIHEALVEIGG